MSDALPQGWATAPLDSLCEKLRGVSYKSDEASPAPKAGYLPILRANNIESDRLTFDELVWVPTSRVNEAQKLRKNDVVVAMSSGSKSVVGKTAQALADWDGAFGAFCGVLRPSLELKGRYFGLFLRTREYRSQISDLAAGSNINNLKNGHFAAIEVPIAPLAEQRRIVAKVEKLLVKVDGCQQRLGKIPVLLKRFRQSVLAAACSGRLTADWRKSCPQVEPVSARLARGEEFRKANVAAANQEGNSFRYKPAAKIDIGNMTKGIAELFDLPTTWEWVSLGQLTWSVADGPHFSPKYVAKDKGVPFISGRHVSYRGIDFGDAKYVSRKDHEEFSKRARPLVDDVLLTKGGTTGIATVVTHREEFSIWVHVALLKVVKELVTPLYLRDALSAPFVYVQSQAQTHGVGNQDLGLTRMVHMAIPLPPLAEQREIVQRVQELFALADRLEARLVKAQAYTNQLTPSVLARAFCGELVPTEAELALQEDRAYEPASILLERIREHDTLPDKTSRGAPARVGRSARAAGVRVGRPSRNGNIRRSQRRQIQL